MRHIRSISLSLLVLAAVAVAVAGCGGANDNQATAATGSGASSATVGVSNVNGLGNILVDSQGHTAYLFQKDTGPKSMCSGECASDWPPITTSGKPSAGAGVTKSILGTSKRSDGTTQVTYNGHPLYRFSGDTKAGDTAGQGLNEFGAVWNAVSPAGNKVEGKAKVSGGVSAY